jgi:hypothetical protein
LDVALKGYQQVAGYEEADYIQPPITVRLYRALVRDPPHTDAEIVDAVDSDRPSTDGGARDDVMLVEPHRGAAQP